MTLTASRVPATDTGIVCAACSTSSNKVRHASVAAVRMCQTSGSVPTGPVRMASLPPVPASAPRTLDELFASDSQGLLNTPAVPVRTPDVPAGRYAVRGLDDVVKFYKVDRPTEGKWAGRTFVSVQASDEFYPVRNRSQRIGILAAILVDPRGASALYGRELGRCGVCNRTLTDPESIAAGIGPVCAEKF